MKRKPPWIAIGTVTLIAICLAVIGMGVLGYIQLDGRVRALEAQQPHLSSDLQATIDFLKDQIQLMIWVMGIIIAGAGAVLAFLGLNTQKSVEEKYDLKYQALMAAKDAKVFEKIIVFLYKDMDDVLLRFVNEIRGRGYKAEMIQTSSLNVTPQLSDASIVVYRVKSASDNLNEEIADWCDNAGTHCILYCPEGIKIPPELMNKKLSYMSISNHIAKLRESLYTLLYLAP